MTSCVACGPVTTEVEVLRSGRRGAQVHATLRDQHSTDGGANVVLTAVFTDPELEGPRLSPLERPVELSEPPGDVVGHRSLVASLGEQAADLGGEPDERRPWLVVAPTSVVPNCSSITAPSPI